MKLKQATFLAIVGVILLIIPTLMWTLINVGVLTYYNQEIGKVYWYFEYLNLVNFVGFILILPFFITLYKSQK